ncbi:MAG: hypothetical protein GTO04_10515 [Planctomycetales bacterium]|nr:hypothetical protein [Planctomycetales bacterium]
MQLKLSLATKWLSWVCVVFSLVFVLGGLGAVLEWFGGGLADILVWGSVSAIFLVTTALMMCLIVQRGRK